MHEAKVAGSLEVIVCHISFPFAVAVTTELAQVSAKTATPAELHPGRHGGALRPLACMACMATHVDFVLPGVICLQSVSVVLLPHKR